MTTLARPGHTKGLFRWISRLTRIPANDIERADDAQKMTRKDHLTRCFYKIIIEAENGAPPKGLHGAFNAASKRPGLAVSAPVFPMPSGFPPARERILGCHSAALGGGFWKGVAPV